ncbi:MAG: hypothetical protein A2V83_07910 [Nitrospirae bacterium RBG_16_64_22]|nr:MAG: hypothetical protein A2V83_07910 [Nitrospirae bacterium RBG_16_64_22]
MQNEMPTTVWTRESYFILNRSICYPLFLPKIWGTFLGFIRLYRRPDFLQFQRRDTMIQLY